MSYPSQRPGANGDGIADLPEAATSQPSRPAITDRTVAMAAELHALPALLTVAETAAVLRVGRSWVYEHATELGAIKLGRGRTAPLRIPRDGVRRIPGAALPQRERRSVPATQARKAETSNGDLRARPRM
ncbi:MAG TPA: helix-turn-helix domain-containing protein [Solirubrobacteraceae bacterium]|nr:helix-turn-helix domain-containing protein [Solirubrobacteraceae bacterium]